ncbi:hypothetical protein ASC77_09030 [Nocardioides sp. Root1257]|uniref:hypothetical protein n=1 Tax=unclassified Nocardioides TaxID=2615069 RepID=UPI0006FF2916|nr:MULTISPECIES: hypothetical protein [unclassified Nocardioides]KQW48859.1 hypothetical protein ASC77_09030 [Nocardioides sp. Root1257]KRC48034.1 hypothetical protein ASE24_09035 [Nocardioides sp. Root224]
MSSTLDSAQQRADAEPTPTRTRSSRIGRRGVAIALVAAVVAVAVVLAVWLTRSPAEAPYADPASSGRLTLCGADGKALTEGSTEDPLLAASVVGATAATQAYAAEGRTAALFAYQPREGLAPSEWSGLQLTAPTSYDDPAAPEVTLAEGDTTLSQFLAGYPATYDGWVQLRLYLAAPGQQVASQQYDAVDLQVDGTSWRAVEPGTASCAPTTP